MRPLLAEQVRRGVELREWESSSHHLTADGLAAFAARQRQRMIEAQTKPSNVKPLKAKKA